MEVIEDRKVKKPYYKREIVPSKILYYYSGLKFPEESQKRNKGLQAVAPEEIREAISRNSVFSKNILMIRSLNF